MDISKVKEWSESSPQAKAMYAYLVSRKRATRGGKPSDLKHMVMRLAELGFTLTQTQVEKELEKLQLLGVGVLEKRANRRAKWVWADNPTMVARSLSAVPDPIEVANGPKPSTIKSRHVIRISRGDTTIEASPEDLLEVLSAIGMR